MNIKFTIRNASTNEKILWTEDRLKSLNIKVRTNLFHLVIPRISFKSYEDTLCRWVSYMAPIAGNWLEFHQL